MRVNDDLLPDRFEVLGELGRGGTSVVYHALDRGKDREVAVKVLLKGTEEDRFQREAERLAALSHPNVVAFLEVGRHGEQDFLVMEYLEMGDLATYTENLSVQEILRLFSQICDGLAHIHDHGIVHRDLKPANILVSKTGQPKITDLGVARQMEQNTRLTQAGTILGTYSFLAPEQILSSEVCPRADLYSLGVCLFVALTGRKPFVADNEFTMLKAHLEEKPPSLLEFLPDAPEGLDELIQFLLSKEVEERPKSARVVADLLQDIVRSLEPLVEGEVSPNWEKKVDELPEDQRSVLLAISYLGGEAIFENICQATPFSEDKTDRCLEDLLQAKFIESPAEDFFALAFPKEVVETRLTSRLRKLFESRLSSLSDSRESGKLKAAESSSSSEASVLPKESVPVIEPKKETEKPISPEDSSAGLVVTPTLLSTSGLKKPIEQQRLQVERKSQKLIDKVEKTEASSSPSEVPKTIEKEEEPSEPAPTPKPKSNRFLISTCMVLLGVLLAGAAQWYWAHSVEVSITTEPEGATVEVNGHEFGTTPLTVSKLRPGVQIISLSLENHKSMKERVELGFRESRELYFSLDPRVGKLHLTLEPRDSIVSIDGQVYEKIDADLTLSSGTHALRVEKKGFELSESELIISEEEILEVNVELAPILGELLISSEPKGAKISLDGVEKGSTPFTLKKVSYGEHELLLELKGHESFKKTIEIKDGKALQIEAVLKELLSTLVIDSVPSGASLKLNGEPQGETPQTLSGLKAGPYTLTLSKDGYHSTERKETVKPGEKLKVDLVLNGIVQQPVRRPASRPVRTPPRYSPPARPVASPPRYNPPPRVPAPAPKPAPAPANPRPWSVE